MTHGGKREGAGRPSRDMAVNRVYTLHDAGVSAREIARKFGVSHSVINRLIKKRNVKL
jgi:IS30 family transposase